VSFVLTGTLGRMLKPERVTSHFSAMVKKHGLPKSGCMT
jgi:hypothetical protein